MEVDNGDFPCHFLILLSWLRPKLWRHGLLGLKCLFLAREIDGLGWGSDPAWRNSRWLVKDEESNAFLGWKTETARPLRCAWMSGCSQAQGSSLFLLAGCCPQFSVCPLAGCCCLWVPTPVPKDSFIPPMLCCRGVLGGHCLKS